MRIDNGIKKMKVLHIVNSLALGGLEKFVVDLTHQMDQVSHTVVCLTDTGEFFNDIEGSTFFLKSPHKLSFSNIFKLKKVIMNNSIDLVHTHNQGPQFYGSMAAKLTRTPILHTKHGQNLSNYKRRNYMDMFSSCLTDIVVSVSCDAHKICIEKLKIPENKVVTILNGVNTNTYQKFKNKKQYTNDRPFVIGTVARLAEEKNQKCLLEACSILMKNSISFNLKIVGDGPLRKDLMFKTKCLGIDKFVEFEGVRRDIPTVMNSFDLFVLPSFTEGVSLTLLEAMSCELPIVATNVGGNSEVVIDGVTGTLVPTDNPVCLASAIMKYIKEPEICLRKGKAGRQRACESFSLSKTSSKYLEIYKKLVMTL